MALKAGYVGVKKSILGIINGLSGMKIIKEIDDGLDLSDDGSLSVDINEETMEFVDGKVSAKAVNIDYSTSEQLTGRKWIDGKDIYEKTYNIGDATSTNMLIDTLANVDSLIEMVGSWNYQLSNQNEIRPIPHFASSSTMVYPIFNKTNGELHMTIATQASTKSMLLTIKYTKSS